MSCKSWFKLFLSGCVVAPLVCSGAVSWQFGKLKDDAVKADGVEASAMPEGMRPGRASLVPGISGQGLAFNGKLRLKVSHGKQLDLINNFTLDCIFRADKIDHYRTIVWKGDRTVNPEQINYYLNIKDGKLEFKFKDAAGEWIVAGSANVVIKAGEWYAVTVTMDADGDIRGYVNGTMCFNRKVKSGKLTVNSAPLYVGGGHGGAYMFEGVMDSLSIAEGVVPPQADIAGKIAAGAEKAGKEMRDLQESARLAVWTFDSIKDGIIPGVRPDTDITVKTLKDGKVLTDGLNGKALVAANGSNVLSVPHSQSISLDNYFTIRCVFKADKTDSYRTLLWKGNRNVVPQQINYYLSLRDGKPEFKFKDAKGDWHCAMSSQAVVEPGKWYCLVVTMDEYGMITGYLNGEVCFRMKYAPGALVENGQPAYIGVGEGYSGGGFAYPFDGLIDELTISRGVNPPSAEEMGEFRKRAEEYQRRFEAGALAERRKLIAMAEAAGLLKGSEAAAISDAELRKMLRKSDYEKFFQKSSGGKSLLVSTLPTARRVLDVKDYVSGKYKLDSRVELLVARNEYEGFQIVVLGNPDRDTKVGVRLPELRSSAGNVIKADALEWGYIFPITTERPEYPVDFVGDYPDAIMEGQMEEFTVPKCAFSTVCVRAGIGVDIPAGVYSGQLELLSGTESYKIDISLEVKDFTLSVTSSVKVVFSFFESFYAQWYNYNSLSDEQKMRIYDFLLKYRISPNNIYASDIYPELKFLPELRKKGANFCTLGYLAEKNKVGQRQLDEIIDIYRKRFDAVSQAGFADMSYLYAFDELSCQSAAEKEAAGQVMTALKKALPLLRSVQTSSPVADIRPYFDVWVPLFNYVIGSDNELEKLRSSGQEFWWYSADEPRKPYPNFFLDYPVFDNRIIFTLSYMYDMKAVLYWCINREWATNMDIKGQWPEKSWKPYIINIHSNKRQFKNGMGNYVYPGKDGRILPSLRLENLRDGVEDYEYLVMLKNLTEELKNKQAGCTMIGEAEKLLKIPATVAVAANDYSADPDHLMKYRREVANMVEKMSRQLKREK